MLDVSRNRFGGYIFVEFGSCRDMLVFVLFNFDELFLVNVEFLDVYGYGESNFF